MGKRGFFLNYCLKSEFYSSEKELSSKPSKDELVMFSTFTMLSGLLFVAHSRSSQCYWHPSWLVPETDPQVYIYLHIYIGVTLSGHVQVWVHEPDLHEPRSPCSWPRSVLSVFKGYAFGPLGQGRADLPEGSHSDGYFSDPSMAPALGGCSHSPFQPRGHRPALTLLHVGRHTQETRDSIWRKQNWWVPRL